jgi:lipoprotein-anchoring transpeptidase ErfK/SrfK
LRAVKVLGLVVVMAVASLLGSGAAVASAAVPDSVAVPAAPGPAATPLPTTVPGTPCLTTARACVELGSNQAWLIRDGVVEYGPVPITHGRTGYVTPPGTFQVSFKNRDHVSSIYNASMPYSVFFNGGIAFHQGSLKEKSHGCIHLSRTAAQTFFGSLGRGDVVEVVA